MQTATAKWTKIATDVANAGFSAHYRGPMGCKDKWQVLFSDYKKIGDYKNGTGNSEDYFRMSSRRRKELNLPSNFCPAYFKEMERFFHQCPCVKPPHQRDNFAQDDHIFETLEQLADYCTENQIDLASVAPTGLGTSRIPPRSAMVPSSAAQRGKEKLDNTARNMNPDPRPVNTAVKRR
jgi:hypothetical protein